MTAILDGSAAWPWRSLPVAPRSVLVGVVAGSALVAAYLGAITVAQGIGHAVDQLVADALFVVPIVAAFGLQVALVAELRTIDRRHRRAATAVATAGTGTSGVAMLACCAHHLVDVLPVLGLSAAAAFLEAYKTPLAVVGMVASLIGLIVLARQLRRARGACAVLAGAERAQARPACH